MRLIDLNNINLRKEDVLYYEHDGVTTLLKVSRAEITAGPIKTQFIDGESREVRTRTVHFHYHPITDSAEREHLHNLLIEAKAVPF